MSAVARDNTPMVQISYECVLRERLRESTTYLYEVACGVTNLTASAHLFMRITGQNTYRNAAIKDVQFTRYPEGATSYLELLESEQLEVRVVEAGGVYSKAFYYAHGQELTEQGARAITSTIERIDTRSGEVE